MRIEVAISKLLDTAHEKDVNPDRLARMMSLTIRKVAETSPAGNEALKLVQRNILKEAIAREFKIGTRNRRRKSELLEAVEEVKSEIRENDKNSTQSVKKRGRGRPRIERAA